MKLVDLFAGAGGASLGGHLAGFQVEAVERDQDACATHQAAVPGPIHCMDVRDWKPSSPVDVIWASPPCQCWSQAGKRLGARDTERNGFPWMWAAVDRAQPTWLICENVKGLTQHSRTTCGDPMLCPGCYWKTVQAEARARFSHVSYRCLNAADYGLPQARRRVFLVCGPEPYRWPAATHCDPASLLAHAWLQPWVSMGAALGLDDGQRAIGGGRNPQSAALAHTRSYRDLTDGPSVTVTAAQVGNRGPWVVDGMRNTPQNPRQERVRPTTEPAPTISGKGNTIISRLELPSPPVNATEVKGHTCPHKNRGQRGRIQRASDALYLTTGRRRLTVQECAILQGFPAMDWKGSKTSQYRQVGNAVPPPLAQALLQAIPKGAP